MERIIGFESPCGWYFQWRYRFFFFLMMDVMASSSVCSSIGVSGVSVVVAKCSIKVFIYQVI